MHIKLQKNYFENKRECSNWLWRRVIPIRSTQKFYICFIEENSYKNEY